MIKHIELLAPAGDIERAKIAINFGVNAIYLGGKKYSLRARANNFSIYDIGKIIQYAHKHNTKVYIVINILCHNGMINNFKNYLDKIMKFKPDGFICADPYIMEIIKKNYPNIEIHISTQQSITNSKACLFWKKAIGAKRIVIAREVDYQNLKKTIEILNGKIDIEYFIHGALCVGYSGHCMMSNNFSLRDANVGGCAQSCRWNWELRDQNNNLISNKFTMSVKDICQIQNLKKLIKANVSSFKIEGRMKSAHYIATVCNNYIHALNDIYQNKFTNKRMQTYIKDLEKAANRDTSFAWFFGQPTINQMLYSNTIKQLSQNFVFVITKKIKKFHYEIISKNYFTISNIFEIFGVKHSLIKNIKILKIYDVAKKIYVDVVNRPMCHFILKINSDILNVGDFGRIL